MKNKGVIMKKYHQQKQLKQRIIISLITFVFLFLLTCYEQEIRQFLNHFMNHSSYTLETIPAYHEEPYITMNNNQPNFTEEERKFTGERYSKLDLLGRCGSALARVGIDTMPTEKRGSIGQIKPSGWHTIKYDHINGKYLYNRCHLIGYQLTGENANPQNLITCTRFMNTTGMLLFENKVANYVRKTNNHVLYRVTPIFEGTDLLARGVTIEAESIEDNGQGIRFYVYIYNVQDGVKINYTDGTSQLIQ